MEHSLSLLSLLSLSPPLSVVSLSVTFFLLYITIPLSPAQYAAAARLPRTLFPCCPSTPHTPTPTAFICLSFARPSDSKRPAGGAEA